MEIIQGFLAGVGTGVIITLIPGMLNMQVVSTSLRIGRRRAYLFNLGLVVVIVAQAVPAVLFADYLLSTDILPTIKQWAIPILAILALGFTVKGYHALKARRNARERTYTGGPFWRGVVMSAMNVLNIPLIFALASFQLAQGILPQAYVARVMFIPGIALGALSVFFVYARLAAWISRHAEYFTRNIYFFLGGLLAVLAIAQSFRVW